MLLVPPAHQRKSGTGADERGFTLVEILIVMVILGILTAMAIPIFQGQRDKANATKAKKNIDLVMKSLDSCVSGINPGDEDSLQVTAPPQDPTTGQDVQGTELAYFYCVGQNDGGGDPIIANEPGLKSIVVQDSNSNPQVDTESGGPVPLSGPESSGDGTWYNQLSKGDAKVAIGMIDLLRCGRLYGTVSATRSGETVIWWVSGVATDTSCANLVPLIRVVLGEDLEPFKVYRLCFATLDVSLQLQPSETKRMCPRGTWAAGKW